MRSGCTALGFLVILCYGAGPVVAFGQTSTSEWVLSETRDAINDWIVESACRSNPAGYTLCLKNSTERPDVLEIRIDIPRDAEAILLKSEFVFRVDDHERHEYAATVRVLDLSPRQNDIPLWLTRETSDIPDFQYEPLRFKDVPDPNSRVRPHSLHRFEQVRYGEHLADCALIKELIGGSQLFVKYDDHTGAYYHVTSFDLSGVGAALTEVLDLDVDDAIILGAMVLPMWGIAPGILPPPESPLYTWEFDLILGTYRIKYKTPLDAWREKYGKSFPLMVP